jgi:hypothetical protein
MGLLNALIDIKEGKLSPDMLSKFDSDDILSIKKVNKNLGNCVVRLKFDEEQYFSIFYDTENDHTNNGFYLRAAFGGNYYRTQDYIFVDGYYMGREDWREGYVLSYFNDENIQKFKEILKYVSPELSDFNTLTDDDKKIKACRLIDELFPNEINDIGTEYATLYDNALLEGMKYYVRDQLCDKFSFINIFEQSCISIYFTTVNYLIKLWERTSSSDDDGILEVLRKLIDNNNLGLEDLSDDYLSYFDYSNFDSDGFNQEVERQLEEIFEKVSEDKESYTQNLKIMNILSKYGIKFDTFNQFPSQKFYGEQDYGYIFSPMKISDGVLTVVVQKNKKSHTIKVSHDKLNDFLLHPEFDF